MKKNVLIVIAVLAGIVFLFCIQSSISNKKSANLYNSLNSTSKSTASQGTKSTGDSKKESVKSNTSTAQETEKKEFEPEVKIDDIELNPVIQQPDSIGQVYITASYKNNSQRTIVGYNMVILLKDSNKKTYLTTYDTVNPGATSPEFKSFGPKTMNKDDIDFLYEEITYIDSNNKKTCVKYDYKLGTYQKQY